MFTLIDTDWSDLQGRHMAQISPLHAAVDAGDLPGVQALVAAGADIEERDGNWNESPTPLCRAAVKGHVAVARYLVERGANKEATTGNGFTSLIAAAEKGHVEVVRMLIEHRANKDTANYYGVTALMWASIRGHVAVTEYLLEQGCDVDRANSNNGYTALHHAAQYNCLEVAQLLLRFGAKLDLRDCQGRNAADLATARGHHDIADAIRAEETHRRERQAAALGGVTTHMAQISSINAAVRAGDLARVQALVAAGADIEERQWSGGPTPLYRAAEKGHLVVARYLVERGADKEATAGNGFTSLIAAAHEGHIDVVRMLIEQGLNKEAACNHGWRSLTLASIAGRVAVVKYLLEQGCKIDHANNDGFTALHVAAINDHLEVAQLLLRFGAKLDVRDKNGHTAADLATRQGHHDIANAIHAEEVRHPRNRKLMAFHAAVAAGILSQVMMLMAAGVDIRLCIVLRPLVM